jgi:sensor histidine kinase YesM
MCNGHFRLQRYTFYLKRQTKKSFFYYYLRRTIKFALGSIKYHKSNYFFEVTYHTFEHKCVYLQYEINSY